MGIMASFGPLEESCSPETIPVCPYYCVEMTLTATSEKDRTKRVVPGGGDLYCSTGCRSFTSFKNSSPSIKSVIRWRELSAAYKNQNKMPIAAHNTQSRQNLPQELYISSGQPIMAVFPNQLSLPFPSRLSDVTNTIQLRDSHHHFIAGRCDNR